MRSGEFLLFDIGSQNLPDNGLKMAKQKETKENRQFEKSHTPPTRIQGSGNGDPES
jgi:hypothetical protein